MWKTKNTTLTDANRNATPISDLSDVSVGKGSEQSAAVQRKGEKVAGSRYYYFTSITVRKNRRKVVVSSQEKSRNRLLRLMTEGKMLWRTPKDATTASVEQQGLDYAQPSETETATKGSGITPQSIDMSPSVGKGTDLLEMSKEVARKVLLMGRLTMWARCWPVRERTFGGRLRSRLRM